MSESHSSITKLLEPSEFITVAMQCDTMSLDTETTDIFETDIRCGTGFAYGISAAVRYDDTYYTAYFPVAHDEKNISDELKEVFFHLIRSRARIIFHNAKFDLPAMRTTGYSYGYIRWYCTLLMAHFLNENVPKKLDWLAKNELHEPGKNKPPEWEMMFAIYGWSPSFPAEIMKLYACEDAVLALKLYFHLEPKFKAAGFDGPK